MNKLHVHIATWVSLKHKVEQKKPDSRECTLCSIYKTKQKQGQLNYGVSGMCTSGEKAITVKAWIVGNFMGRVGAIIQGCEY